MRKQRLEGTLQIKQFRSVGLSRTDVLAAFSATYWATPPFSRSRNGRGGIASPKAALWLPNQAWGGEEMSRQRSETDKQPALSLQPHRRPQSQSWLVPASAHTCICSLVTVILGKAVPGEHRHSMMPKSTHSRARQVWIQVTAPWYTCCLCGLPNLGDRETGVSHL